MDNFSLYNDIKARTDGEIYIGVVGPVRSGKSTFIRKFLNLMIIPGIENPNEKERVIDEMPQAAAGRTVMTTEPKFIPKDSVEINMGNGIKAKFRLIDCVGYLVKGSQGVYEDDKERLVNTPWFSESIPFSKAAEYGTGKVIKDHSTIGIVVTTDGSFGEISRENYIDAEEKTIAEIKKTNKPFIVILNSARPKDADTKRIAESISQKHNVTTLPFNCEQLGKDDINEILLRILYEFPVGSIEFYIPKWAEMLGNDNEIRKEITSYARNVLDSISYIRDIKNIPQSLDLKYISKVRFDNFDFSEGVQKITISIDDKYYYENLSLLTGENIKDEYELISLIRNLSVIKKDYGRYIEASRDTKIKGYGVVIPDRSEIILSDPEIIKTNNKYGVRIKAESPSIHMIKVNIGTEISPIVGSEDQARDLVSFINENNTNGSVWDTSIFGKSIGQLIEDGIRTKIQMINDDCQIKLQETMQKVVNENSGGLVCLII